MTQAIQQPPKTNRRRAAVSAMDFMRYIGPGLLVTVGFIDPGNWATNVLAGSSYGYSLLWVVTLSTVFLIVLQHNAAHLGIVTGYCLSEAATLFIKPRFSRFLLGSAVLASVATTLAEIFGGAIALNMLFGLPVKIGAVLVVSLVGWMLLTNSYKKLENWIIGFVSLIGLSFLIELLMIRVDWPRTLTGWVTPAIPKGSMLVIMSVLGAVVMPHNLFLHSEVIQSRQWNLEDAEVKERYLKYEFMDTLLSMGIGWAINSAMIIIAAATFFARKIPVTELNQAHDMLHPILGNGAALLFALALLFSGIASCVTAGMAGGSIVAGFYGRPYHTGERGTRLGIGLTLIPALFALFLIGNPFDGLVYSQTFLSIQLPLTIFLQIHLTSSPKIMGNYTNPIGTKILLWIIGITVCLLNLMLLIASFGK